MDYLDNSNFSVLLIEDDKATRELYLEILREGGFKVEPVVNGSLALEKIRNNHYDVILLDIVLPDIDGIGILKEIKRSEIKQGPVVVISNLTAESTIKTAMEEGAVDYINKTSITPDKVLDIVQTTIQSSQKTLEKR